MGIHNESTYTNSNALEAEMCRRLWWSLVVFDNRICEMSNSKTTMLSPNWDCKTPLNMNDSDIHPEMKFLPVAHDTPTETIFAVVRSELADFVRQSDFHLDFTNPSLKSIARSHGTGPECKQLVSLEHTIDDKYFKVCNPENPLHFMTIWTTRSHFARHRLSEYFARFSKSSVPQTDAQRNNAISHALSMLECDTEIMTSPLTKGYLWFAHLYFPFTSYIHIVQDLKRRPIDNHAEKCWRVMSENYEARFSDLESDASPFFNIFSRIVLQAWAVREEATARLNVPLEVPRMVLDLRQKVMEMTPNTQINDIEQQSGGAVDINFGELSMDMPVDVSGSGVPLGIGGQGGMGSASGGCPEASGQAPMDVNISQLDWAMIDWNLMHARGW